jgi:hypothetical protein
VQIGNSNVQRTNLDIRELILAVDHSKASDLEKEEAKSLIQRVSENKLVASVLGALLATMGPAQ